MTATTAGEAPRPHRTEAVPDRKETPSALRPKRARVLLTGTLAIDHIGEYPGVFSALPRHRGINLTVHLRTLARRFGGCAMNIAYTLRLLGDDPAPFVFVGADFAAGSDYAAHLEALEMDTTGITITAAPRSANAFLFTDREGSQFTAFHPGPAVPGDYAVRLARFAAAGGFEFAVLAPDLPANMLAAASALRAAGIPFLTDPGQNITDFNAALARRLVGLSERVIVNEFEHETLRGLTGDDALAALELLVVTRGEQGACWRSRGSGAGQEAAVAANARDPTGCGDAFRGGFVHAQLRGAGPRAAIRAGLVAAGAALEVMGTQTHRLDRFPARYHAAWDEALAAPG